MNYLPSKIEPFDSTTASEAHNCYASVNVMCWVHTAFKFSQKEILTEPSHVFSQPVDQKPDIYLDLRLQL